MLSNVSVQDRDLLARLTNYFDHLELRVREGQGWLIFNAPRPRGNRITQFVAERLKEFQPLLSYYVVPWRDFSLNAYMMKIELASLTPPPPTAPRLSHEYRIAGRVSQDMYFHMRYADVLVLGGVQPSHPHEVEHLLAVVEMRLQERRPLVLITPDMPHELGRRFDELSHHEGRWDQLFDRLYQSNLIAL